MADVVIVSRTKMSNGVCIGGYDASNGINIRLLTSGGDNQPATSPYQIGQKWNINYTPRPGITAPHTEDVLVTSQQYVGNFTSQQLNTFIDSNCAIVTGSIDLTFQGTLARPSTGAPYVASNSVPNHSVCFWKPDRNLTLVSAYNKTKYLYSDAQHESYFPYVGTANPIPTITAGTIVRMSLARWWSAPNSTEMKCYAQISGWY